MTLNDADALEALVADDDATPGVEVADADADAVSGTVAVTEPVGVAVIVFVAVAEPV